MEAFCTLVTTRDCDAEVRNELEQSGYEVWISDEDTFISINLLYCENETSVDTMSYDFLQKRLCEMAEDLDVSLSDIEICMNMEKGE